jgi:hypothetical protein
MVMSGRLIVLVPIVLAVLLLSGCAAGEGSLTAGPVAASAQPTIGVLARNGDIEPTGPRPTEQPQSARETFSGGEVLSEGQNLRYESFEPLFQVITTQQALRSFWQTYLPPGAPLPQVDFEHSFVLAGIQGNKSTGGFGISFTGLQPQGDEVRVITDWTEPGCSDIVDMGFTQPYTVLRVDSSLLTSSGALIFLFETETGRHLGRVPATLP